jgi:23S rRNA U2552 (ribose-2'-O)-methylase RlmE/FtsJ
MEHDRRTTPPWNQVFFQKSPLKQDLSGWERNVDWSDVWVSTKIRPILPWKNPHLEQDLYDWKEKIAPFEAEHSWERLKKMTNPYELIHTPDADGFPSSVSLLKPLSRSFFKMIEMFDISAFFDKLPKQGALRSAHVAEGPGGFIEAFLERAEINRRSVTEIFAMTLKSNHNHVPGWRRAYTFLQKHPEIKIHYGKDGTGNLYNPENQESFIQLCSKKVQLFTADGGFDFSVDYQKQEELAFQLLVCSAWIGCSILAKEGMMVIKIFDIFGHSTFVLLRILSSCFREWTLYKPATSRSCNSERYFIGRGFRGMGVPEKELLLKMKSDTRFPFHPSPSTMFHTEEWDFLQNHVNTMSQDQMETLSRAFQLKDTLPESLNWKQHLEAASEWCRKFRIYSRKI